MGACFLIPSGILAALIARETTGRGQHVRTSLFQGALLYTTQIWQHVEKAPAAFHDLMGKSYPPGVHQQMLFEVEDDEWVHSSVMSGLTPTKSQDELLGLEDPPDPMTFLTMAPEEREKFTAGRRAAYLTHDRDELVRELPVAQPRDRGGDHDGGGARQHRPPASPARRQRHGRHRRRPRARPHHPDRRADQPARHARARSRVRSRCPASTTARSSARSATPTPSSRRSREERSDGRARRRPARRLRPVPRGPVRPDDHRRPRRRGDQGRAGDRRRHAARGQAVLRLPARQARRLALDLKTPRGPRARARADRARRHRPPQHDRGRREQARHRVRRLQGA